VMDGREGEKLLRTVRNVNGRVGIPVANSWSENF